MIQVIAGGNGSGKTKRLIDMTNAAIESERGDVVFVDKDKSYIYDLKREVRFVDASEYLEKGATTADTLIGFLSGMLSVNYDITLICIDAFVKLIGGVELAETEHFFARLERLSQKSGCSFVLNVGCDTESLPAFISCYAI